MSFTGVILRVEDGPLGNRTAADHPEQTYPRWRLILQCRGGIEQSALTGRVDIVERAKGGIGKIATVLRGGKVGIVGGIHICPIDEMIKQLELSGWAKYNGSHTVWQSPLGHIYRGPALAFQILCHVVPDHLK